MESCARIFPCGDLRCNYHAKVYHRRFAPRQTNVKARCLLTSAPLEILQQIAMHLDIVSQASFAVSHAIIRDAIGTRPWELFQRSEYSKNKAEFLDLLLSDYVDEDCHGSGWCQCVIPCHQCALVHNLQVKSNRTNELLITRSLLTDNATTFYFCNGAYSIPQRCVKLALEKCSTRNRYGICTAFLRCSGTKQLDIPPAKNNPDREPNRTKPSFSYQKLDENPKGSNRDSRSNLPYLSPSGGNLRTRARRFRSRLYETRADIQGREWWFYFPMTLFFFIPGSRPFRVRQKARERDDTNRNGSKSEQAETPKHESSTIATGADSTVSTGNVPVDHTGWTQYYEELEARESFDLEKTLAAAGVVSRQTPYVYYLYERKSGKTPWYDKHCVEVFLDGWNCTKFAKLLRRCFIYGGNDHAPSVGTQTADGEYDSVDDSEEDEETYSRDGPEDYESSHADDVDGNGSASKRCRTSTSLKRSLRGRLKKKRILLNELQSSTHEDRTRTAHRPITLRYSIEPKVVNGSFLIHASYSFSDPGSERLCADLRNLAFRICPHVNTFSKSASSHRPSGSEKPILTLPDPLMSCANGLHTMYEDSCWHCDTDYIVKLAYRGESPKYVAEVAIEAWHEIRPAEIDKGDPSEQLDTGGKGRWMFERRHDVVCAKWHEWDHFLAHIQVDTY